VCVFNVFNSHFASNHRPTQYFDVPAGFPNVKKFANVMSTQLIRSVAVSVCERVVIDRVQLQITEAVRDEFVFFSSFFAGSRPNSFQRVCYPPADEIVNYISDPLEFD
jgi:hypothetical protein